MKEIAYDYISYIYISRNFESTTHDDWNGLIQVKLWNIKKGDNLRNSLVGKENFLHDVQNIQNI